jgi:hypothetical protein
MGQLEQTRARCKSLRLTWMAQQLPQLLGEAESNQGKRMKASVMARHTCRFEISNVHRMA